MIEKEMLQLELSKYLLVRGQYVFEFKQDHILMTPKLKNITLHYSALLNSDLRAADAGLAADLIDPTHLPR